MCKLVSVIVPCYNSEKFIQESLFSVLSQTYRDLEVICIDDGSKDSTKEVIQKVAALDERVLYIYQENTGVAIARNNAVNLSHGEYIVFIDSDDLISPNFVESLVNAIETTGCDVATPFFYKFEKPFDMQLCTPRVPSKFRMSSDNVCVCESLFRKADFIRLGGFDAVTFKQGFEDYDLWLNFISHGLKIVRVKEAFSFYRQHGDGSSFNAGALKVMAELNQKLKDKYPFVKKYQLLNKFTYIFTNFNEIPPKLMPLIPHGLKRLFSKISRFVFRKKVEKGCTHYKIFKLISFKLRKYEV